MQPFTASPRQGLTETAVRTLLTSSPSVQIKGGVEQYDASLNFVADLSSNLQVGSSVTSDCFAEIHRSCTLVMDADSPFNYLSDYLKPYVVMTDNNTGISARFNLGMYQLTSPTPDLTLSPGVSSYSGLDLLQVLNQPVGDSYAAAAADPVTQAAALVQVAFPPATVQFEPYTPGATVTLIAPVTQANTYLEVVNSLLATAGYLPVWVDWNGVFQMHPYQDPRSKDAGVSPIEWVFDLTPGVSGNVVAQGRSVYQDLYDIPNLWIFVMNNLQDAAPAEGSTQFTFADLASPMTGITARGRTVSKVVSVDAADYPALVATAVRQIERDVSPVEAFAIATWPLPLFWHRDLCTYRDPSLGNLSPLNQGARTVIVGSWTLPLDADSGNMTLTLLTLNSTTSAAFSDA